MLFQTEIQVTNYDGEYDVNIVITNQGLLVSDIYVNSFDDRASAMQQARKEWKKIGLNKSTIVEKDGIDNIL